MLAYVGVPQPPPPPAPLSFVAQGGTEMKSLLLLTVFGSAYGFWTAEVVFVVQGRVLECRIFASSGHSSLCLRRLVALV